MVALNTAFLLMAQYHGMAVIPLETVRRDYFPHLQMEHFLRKLAAREIPLPVVRMEESQKSAKGIALNVLADYLDRRMAAAEKEMQQLKAG